MIFGFVGGLVFPVMTMMAPQPLGSIIFFGVMTIYMTWGALRMWRRTGLPFISTAVLLSAVMSATMVVAAAAGVRFPGLPFRWAIPFYSMPAMSVLLMFVEQHVHAHEWEIWRQHMEHMGAWDVFTGRHIPDLRHRTT
jgi:hypothetical protein